MFRGRENTFLQISRDSQNENRFHTDQYSQSNISGLIVTNTRIVAEIDILRFPGEESARTGPPFFLTPLRKLLQNDKFILNQLSPSLRMYRNKLKWQGSLG